MNWKRHTLVYISDAGRERIVAELAGKDMKLREELANLLLPDRVGAHIPGIVRWEEGGKSALSGWKLVK